MKKNVLFATTILTLVVPLLNCAETTFEQKDITLGAGILPAERVTESDEEFIKDEKGVTADEIDETKETVKNIGIPALAMARAAQKAAASSTSTTNSEATVSGTETGTGTETTTNTNVGTTETAPNGTTTGTTATTDPSTETPITTGTNVTEVPPVTDPVPAAEEGTTTVGTVTYVKPYRNGIIGCEGVDFGGSSRLDSFNSNTGEENLGHASIISLMPAGHIDLGGSSTINGSVITHGPGSNISIGGKAQVNGIDNVIRATGTIADGGGIGPDVFTSQNEAGIPLDNCDPIGIAPLFEVLPYTIEEGETVEVFSISSGEKVLDQAFYKFKGFTLDGSSKLVVSGGEVKVYVTENQALNFLGSSSIVFENDSTLTFYISGVFTFNGDTSNAINSGNTPGRLFILSNYKSDGGIKVSGKADFNAVVYAPYSAVSFASQIIIRGSFRGRTITNRGGATFLYDEALKDFYTEVMR